jgi:hypothetical protein
MFNIFVIIFFCVGFASLITQIKMKSELKKNGYGIDLTNSSDLRNFRRLIKKEKSENKKRFYKKLLWAQFLLIFATLITFLLIIYNNVK